MCSGLLDVRSIFDECSISHFLSTTSDFPFPISYVSVSFRSSFAHFPLPMARPGGVRGAIEYGQPPCGLSCVRALSRNCRSQIRLCFREAKYAAVAHSAGPGRPYAFRASYFASFSFYFAISCLYPAYFLPILPILPISSLNPAYPAYILLISSLNPASPTSILPISCL